MNVYSLARDACGPGGLGPWLAAVLVALSSGLASSWVSAAEPGLASVKALELIEKTPESARGKLVEPFTDTARSDWHYVPRSRAGVAWREMNGAQREAATALLRTALTDTGLTKVRAIMALEIALRELEASSSRRDPDNYAIAIFGTPSGKGHWGFRIEGHHLSLHFTLEGDRYVATLPQFMGANPALVPRDFKGGPAKGVRVLGTEEDLARQLLGSLAGPAHASAIFDVRPYGDIVTRNAPKLSPLAPVGVKFTELSGPQQATLLKLCAVFAEHLQPELAEARLTRIRKGGVDSIRFGWAGSTLPGEPHYFRIQGATFLIEFDNSAGNHIHSVWRDFEGDWGRDILGEHYARAGHPGHSHP